MKNNKRLKYTGISLLLIFLLINAMYLSVSIGEIKISFGDIRQIMGEKQGIAYDILTKIRIPRIVLAFSVGGALSLAGAILQGIYRNPLVEPYTLGISGGAVLGVTICIVFGAHASWGVLSLPVSGFIGALLTIFLVYILSTRHNKGINTNKMLLVGVMISFISSSGMLFLMSISTTENLHDIIFWIMGSLDEPNDTLIKITFYSGIIGLLVSYFFVTELNALRLGEVRASHLGIKTARTIKIFFVLTSLLTGISVAVVGMIGFVGLIIPHLMRLIIGTDYRILLLSSFLGGGIFLILCDIVARTIISPNQLPIGVITGIVGGIIFIVALSKTNSSQTS